MSIRIGILGTRGIPNHYGGFERLAEQLSCGLVNMGHEVFVYNSHNHVYQNDKWRDVQIIHCYDPEYLIGCSGQFVYDLNCILDARKRKFDVILMLGYTSSSIWGRLFPGNAVVIYNMDGMEWQRAKYSKMTRRYLKYAEKLAVQTGDFFVTDSPAIQTYYQRKYALNGEYIAYGAELFEHEDEKLLAEYDVSPYDYYLLVSRMEPENNVEMILDGFRESNSKRKFLVVGNTANKFGKHLVQKFHEDSRIRFADAIFEEQKIHSLRFYSQLYFHGHSTGGTNPSLLEAMASKAFIVAHENIFNKTVLEKNAFYFSSANDIRRIVETTKREELDETMLSNNLAKIRREYNWHNIFEKYERFMLRCLYIPSHERNILHKRYAG